MRHATILLAVVVVLAMAAVTTQAAVVLHEPFDYATGTLSGKSGTSEFGFVAGSNWYGTNDDSNKVVEGSLAYTGIMFEGGASFAPVGNRAESGIPTQGDHKRAVNDTVKALMSFNANKTFYASALVRVTGVTGSDPYRPIFHTADDGYYGIALYGYDLYLCMPDTGEIAKCATLTSGSTYFVVMKFVASATGLDWGYMRVYSSGDTVPADEPTTGWTSQSTITYDVTDEFRLYNYPAVSGRAIDEARVGESWSDVTVPEPATLSLLAVGAAAMLVRRKRH